MVSEIFKILNKNFTPWVRQGHVPGTKKKWRADEARTWQRGGEL